MMKIVINAGYHGYVGIEWVGETPSEPEGVRLTKRFLENVQEDPLGELTSDRPKLTRQTFSCHITLA